MESGGVHSVVQEYSCFASKRMTFFVVACSGESISSLLVAYSECKAHPIPSHKTNDDSLETQPSINHHCTASSSSLPLIDSPIIFLKSSNIKGNFKMLQDPGCPVNLFLLWLNQKPVSSCHRLRISCYTKA